ncbi:MAG: hypothetical protein H0W56_08425, partial [Acidothermales bacterium]|nr:hypothetical protein [Acidothermales bacterium]
MFQRLRAAHELPDLTFQVGIPGDFDIALFVLGPVGAFLHRRPFTEATLREIRAIHEQAGDDVAFQIEVPAEMVFIARLPDPLQPLMARLLARGIARLAQSSPPGARFGVHLCLGDMNHRALARMRDLSPIVHLANALIDAWPRGRPLEYVHAPFPAAETPAPTDSARSTRRWDGCGFPTTSASSPGSCTRTATSTSSASCSDSSSTCSTVRSALRPHVASAATSA